MDLRIATTLAGGVALGVVLGLAVGGALGPAARGADAPGTDPALVAELERVRATQADTAAALDRIADALEGGDLAPVGPASGRTVGGTADAPSLEALTASLEALRVSIETESRRTQETIRAAPALGGETLGDVRARNASNRWDVLETLEEEWRADEDAANRSQYFQTARDLLRTYGPPGSIYRPKDSLLYVYRRHAEGEAGPAWYFRIQDGYVVEFFLDDETADDG